jgi:hypothetical protein
MTFSVWIMATDIAVNLSVAWYYDWPTGVFADGRLSLQIAFGLCVFFTVPHRSPYSSYAQETPFYDYQGQ